LRQLAFAYTQLIWINAMSGDFSRFSFDPKKQFTAVLMQQGRVMLDADWNEMQAILSRHQKFLVNDLVGKAAYPEDNPAFTPHIQAGVRFDGVDDAVVVKNATLDFSRNSSFTVVVRVNLDEKACDRVLLSQWHYIEAFEVESGICFGINAAHQLYLQRTIVSEDAVEIETVTADTPIPCGEDVSLAVAYDGKSVNLYADHHLLLHTRDIGEGYLEHGPVTIGAHILEGKPQRCFSGIIYDMAVWSRALSKRELKHHIFAHRRADDVGLQAWWPFSEGEGKACHDVSGHNNDAVLGTGTKASMPAWESPTLSFLPGRVYLEGALTEQLETVVQDIPKDEHGHFLAYISQKQRLVSAVDDPDILEPALQGADTTLRIQNQVSVRLFPEEGSYLDRDALYQAWERFNTQHQSTGQLRCTQLPSRPPLYNALYRVQIAKTTNLEQQNELPVLWTADNSSLSYRVTAYSGNHITLEGMGRYKQHFQIDDHFMLLDNDNQPVHAEDALLTVTAIDVAAGVISFSGDVDKKRQPVKLLHWCRAISTVLPNKKEEYTLTIDNRLCLLFKPEAHYQQGDYWLIPTREASDDLGDLETEWHWPFESAVHFQPVAELQAKHGAVWIAKDCRKHFPAAAQLDQFVNRSGATMTGPLVLEDTLQVRNDTSFEGKVTFNGGMNKHCVGTSQLQDHAVTHHKLQRNLGLHLGQCILSQNPIAPEGFSMVGKIAGDTEHVAWHACSAKWPALEPFAAYSNEKECFGLYGNGELYEITSGKKKGNLSFKQKAKFPGVAVRQFAGCMLKEHLYIVGGVDKDGTKTDQCYRYHPAKNKWQKIASLPHALSHVSLCAHEGTLYAMGGLKSALFGLLKHDPVHTLYRYDHKKDTWHSLASMPEKRYSGGAVALDGMLHYIGGSNRALAGLVSESFSRSHYCYDIEKDRWHERAAIPLPRSRFGIIEAEGRIFCLGGRTGAGYTANVQVYHPATDSWEAAASLGYARSHIAAVQLKGTLYALGGKNEEGYIDFAECQNKSAEFYVHRLEKYLD
jgi:hypothetical protein